MMSFEEYRKLAFKSLKEQLDGFPEEEINEYINSLEEDVKRSYNTAVEMTNYLGTDQIATYSYAYGKMVAF